MDTIKTKHSAGQKRQYCPRLAGEILHDYLENSNEPLARAYREHVANEKEDVTSQLFETIFPSTELDVDLKLFTLRPGRLNENEFLPGMLTRDGENHYSFVQNATKKKVALVRNPHLFRGRCVNVVRKADGTRYTTFNRPDYSESFTFKHFCLQAAEELLMIAGLVGEEAG